MAQQQASIRACPRAVRVPLLPGTPPRGRGLKFYVKVKGAEREGGGREERMEGGRGQRAGGREGAREREREREMQSPGPAPRPRCTVGTARSTSPPSAHCAAAARGQCAAKPANEARSMRSEASQRDEVNAQRSQPTRRGQCAAKPANEARSMRSKSQQTRRVCVNPHV